MIILVPSIIFLTRYLVQYYRRRQAWRQVMQIKQEWAAEDQRFAERQDSEEFERKYKFHTPVCSQRYVAVQQEVIDNLIRYDIHKVVEFGCNRQKFFKFLKTVGVREILLVDIDAAVLNNSTYVLNPSTVDYIGSRLDPLVVQVLCGSCGDPDYRLQGTDAVVAIELIEHLYPDSLDAFVYNVFGFMKPSLVVLTTPNADFNILFPNFKQFRDPDHKFEWTREQFEDWAKNITDRFPQYTVTFKGIAKGPKGTESVGCCSQMATFIKEFPEIKSEVPSYLMNKSETVEEDLCKSFGICTYYSYFNQIMALEDLNTDLFKNVPTEDYDVSNSNHYYKCLLIIEYPYTPDVRTRAQKILDEVTYKISKLIAYSPIIYLNDETDNYEIPFCELTTFDTEAVCSSVNELRQILANSEFTVKECPTKYFMNDLHPCVIVPAMIRKPFSDSEEQIDEEEEHEEEEEVQEQVTYIDSSETDWSWDVQGGSTDWDHVDLPKKPLEEEATTDSSNHAELFDSGYQKSNDWSPVSPVTLQNGEWPAFKSNFEGLYDGVCDSIGVMDVNDIKDKAITRSEINSKQINNRTLTECPTPFRRSPVKENVAGTSQVRKKRKARKSEGDDDSLKEEVKQITQCIVYNSLNKLDVDDNTQLEADELPESTRNSSTLRKLDVLPLKLESQIITRVPILDEPKVGLSTSSDAAGKSDSSPRKSQMTIKVADSIPGSSSSKKYGKAHSPKKNKSSKQSPVIVDAEPINPPVVRLEPPRLPEVVAVIEPLPIVENGDLANNNRDGEGNNYPERAASPVVAEIVQDDHANDNIDAAQPLPEANNLDEQNRNVVVVPLANNVPLVPYDVDDEGVAAAAFVAVAADVKVVEPDAAPGSETDELSLSHASREALFDPNSQADMLEEFVFPETINEEEDGEPVLLRANFNVEQDQIALPEDVNPFPNWLLQLLTHQTEDDENHDAHFYCQGDGLGVHPSVIEVDVEDTTSETSTSNDDAQAERTLSEEEDVGSLSTDNPTENATLVVVGRSIEPSPHVTSSGTSNESNEEYYDTIDDNNDSNDPQPEHGPTNFPHDFVSK